MTTTLTKKSFFLGIILFTLSFSLFAQNGKITLDSLYPNKVYKPTGLSGMQWRPDGKSYTFLKYNRGIQAVEIYEHDLASGKEFPVVEAANLKVNGSDQPVALSSYQWSPDNTHILITGVLPARTLKTGGTIYIYDLAVQKINHIIESDAEQENVSFSPDGKFVSFIRGNNLFVHELSNNKTVQLTFDGSETILNGIFDWVYEEEFSIIQAYEWAPDSKAIAFWRMDQSQEPIISIARYDSLYLNPLMQRYPKAGGKNALVKIGVADIASEKTTWMDLGAETDIYIPRIKYTADPKVLSIQRLNRLQQKLDLLLADCSTGSTKTVLSEQDSCWIEIEDVLTFLKDGKHFIWVSETDGYKHLYLYSMDGKLIKQLTKGPWEVDKLKYVDEDAKKLFYTSNERGVMWRDLYSVNLDGTDKKLLSETKGTHVPSFSAKGDYYVDIYSNATTPPATRLYSVAGRKIADLTKADESFKQKYAIGSTEFLQFKTSDGEFINACMIKPPDFDPVKKYPVLFYNYSGPGSQAVKDEFGSSYPWHQMLAQNGYIIFTMDNRGTGGRGAAFKHLAYKKLGTWEPHDLIEGAKFLAKQSYVDAARIGIMGWSYGGYISALTLMKGADYFKMAVAIAPVTSWRFYDDIYTERYMSLPELNPEGYKLSEVMAYSGNLRGKLLLIHGTADDNVHFQNSVVLAEKLISENRQFTTMFYPGKEHSIYGGRTRQHLFTMITNFILQNL